ncbi:MAG: leucyl/phenylalanyl-tRNA--protein transferase [Paracoccus sp. (in: a-proteobacteria)]
MLWGYANGIFPMALSADDPALHWFDPPERGTLPVGGVHMSRSMRKYLQHVDWQVTLNVDFSGTVQACASRDKTWINTPLFRLYEQLHRMGHAHSLEIRKDNALIGGIFGLTIGAAFFGESMFSRCRNASKAALIFLSAHLRQCGYTLFDTQFPTPHLTSMGGQTITRKEYRQQLDRAIRKRANISSLPLPDLQAIIQASTQTS